MERLQRVFIKKIVDDLTSLNGTEFEFFCRPIFESIINERSYHKGSNLYAKPVGRTSDFSDLSFTIVGQCGTDEDYFDIFSTTLDRLRENITSQIFSCKTVNALLKVIPDGAFTKTHDKLRAAYKTPNEIINQETDRLEEVIDKCLRLKIEATKPIKDIISAIKNSGQCEKIFLFANQEAKAGRLSNLHEAIQFLQFKQEVLVYDSEAIADIICEKLPKQNSILSLLDYLPTASHIYLAMPMSNGLPPLDPNFVVRKEENAIRDMILNNKVSVIHGVSGIGKSKIALSLAHKLRDRFDSIIWISAGEGKEVDFKSVKLGEFDKNFNVANLCSTYNALIVLDNFFGDRQDIEAVFDSFANSGSRLLITSLRRSSRKEICFHLSEMSMDESKAIINTHIDLNSQFVDEIVSCIGGHPLCLQLVCQIIEDEGYNDSQINDFLKEIKQIVDEIIDEKSQTISDLVIGRYKEKFQKEFSLISLLNSEQISNYIFNKILGMRAIRNLEKTSLIVYSGLSYSNIHSIVLLSIKNLTGNETIVEELKKEICKFLLIENEFKNAGYYSFCIMHNDLLKVLYNENFPDGYRKALLYAIIKTTDDSVSKKKLINEVENFDLSGNKFEDLLLLIEALESKLVSINRKNNQDEYEHEADNAIEKLNIINQRVSERNNIKLLLEHHIAKIFFWKGDTDTAKDLFESLLKKFPESEQCMLHLARIADVKKEYDEAKKYVDNVLGSERHNFSHSIVLSFYDLISSTDYQSCKEKYIKEKIDDFISNITITLHSSFDHPYRVLSSLSSYLCYNLPEVFTSLCLNLPLPDNVINNPKLMMAYADIQMALYRLYKYRRDEDRDEKLRVTSSLAEKYYIDSRPNNDFDNLKVAKFYIEIEEYNKAWDYLVKISKHDPFYYQSLAKQRKGICSYEEALEAIDNAIQAVDRGECKDLFLASFLNDKAEILYQIDIDMAIGILTMAIEKETIRRTKDAWQKKLSAWKQRMKNDQI